MADVAPVGAAAEVPFALLPGVRFHPTDQELLVCFLTRKVLGLRMELDIIPVVDHCRFEPHELPDRSFSPSTGDPGDKVVCYFFAPRGRKYPTGLRMERATSNGFWKSTGKDRPVMHNGAIVGMKKTLVFHAGRAPRGTRTDWVMHEFRLHGHHIQDTYALCRVFNKNMVTPSTDVSGGADADEDPIHFVPGGNGGVQFLSGGGDKRKGVEQFATGGDITEKRGTNYVAGGAYIDRGAMKPLTVDTEKQDAGKDKSWMEFLRGDVYWSQFIPDDGWNSRAES